MKWNLLPHCLQRHSEVGGLWGEESKFSVPELSGSRPGKRFWHAG